MRTHIKRAATLLLSLVLLLGALPFAAQADSVTGFPDVGEGDWYVQYLGPIMALQQQMGVNNIISGYPDGNFGPEDLVTRCQFLKMIYEAVESAGGQITLVTQLAVPIHGWADKYYQKAEASNTLIADPYASSENDTTGTAKSVQLMFPHDAAAMDEPMTRYEMAVVLNNVCRNIAMQKTVNVDKPEEHITDYASIPEEYRTAVEQMYGKGLLTGYGDYSFGGDDTLTRAQAVTVIYRFLWNDTINGEGLQDWASYPEVKSGSYLLSDPSESFANRLRSGGHVNAWGTIDDWARTELFGSPYISYFSSSAQAGDHMVTVSVPIWTVNSLEGTVYPDDPSRLPKKASTVGITVNKAVAAEVHDIFQMIFDDPERFPIYGGWSAGGARYTDTMRHSWGCAIDVNALYNCECNFWPATGYLKVTCGYGWRPLNGTDNRFLGSMSLENSVYSIGKNAGEYGYSVVRAFATYGWGWGGNGYGQKSDGHIKYDYMHFSILPSGG